jgi:hypothetical protein
VDDIAHRVTPTGSERIVTSVADVGDWMHSNRLQLNIDKKGLLWRSSSRRQHQLPSTPLSFGRNDVTASSMLRKLGVFVNSDLSLRHHVNVFTARFRQLRSIHYHVSVPMISLVTSLIHMRLVYCNSVLFGFPGVLVSCLQSFQNAATRVVFNLRRTAHVTDALICLHRLQVPEHIRFKVAVLVYR